MAETDIRIINGRKLQDIDLRKKFDTFKDSTTESLDQIYDLTDPFAVNIRLEPRVAELGSIVDLFVEWSYNRDIVSQTINLQDTIAGDRKMYFYGLDQDETINISAVNKKGQETSGYATLSFCNGIYYGASTTYRYFDSTFIMALDNKVLSNDRERTIVINPKTAGYIYYCLPSRLGKCYFSLDFELIDTIDFTNPSGYTESYDIYRTPITSLKTQTITIRGYYEAEYLKQEVDGVKNDIDNIKEFALTCELIDDETDAILDENYKIEITNSEVGDI